MADEFSAGEQQLHDLLAKIRKRSTSPTIDQWTLDGDAVLITLMATVRSKIAGAGTIVPPPAFDHLSITTQPSSTPSSGTAFAQQPVIQLRGAGEAAVGQAGVIVTAALASGTGTLSGTLTATTDSSGVATFTDLVITGLTGARTIGFSAPGATGVTSNTVTVAAGAAATITATTVTSQGAATSTNVSVPMAVVVLDASTNPVAGTNVTFAIASQAGTGATITPSVQPIATDSNGAAALTAMSTSDAAGTDTVTATSAGLTGSPITFSVTVTAAFARKPTITTPTAPTPLQTYYFDFAAGNDSTGDGSSGNPYKTITKSKTLTQVGSRFYLKGTFTGTGEYLGGSTQTGSGTAVNPVQYMVWPGQSATINGGGGGSGAPSIYISGSQSYYWVQGVTLAAPSGTDGGKVVGSYGTANSNWTFVSVTVSAGAVNLIKSSDFAWYDCTFSATVGSGASNSGDVITVANRSHRGKMIRCTFSGKAYHSTVVLGNIFSGLTSADTCDDWQFFDCNVQNTAAGGVHFVGLANAPTIEWCYIHDVGTNTEGFSPASRAAFFGQCPSITFRFNWIDTCEQGLNLQSYVFGGITQACNNGHFYCSTVTRCSGRPFAMYCFSNLAADTYMIGNVFENLIVYGNQTGGATYNNGYFESEYFPAWFENYGTTSPWASGIGTNVVRNCLIGRLGLADTKFAIMVRASGNGGNSKWTKTQFEAACSGSVNNLANTDPLFVDLSGGDVHLQAGSSLKDAGYATSGVAYQGAAPAIGLYETVTGD